MGSFGEELIQAMGEALTHAKWGLMPESAESYAYVP